MTERQTGLGEGASVVAQGVAETVTVSDFTKSFWWCKRFSENSVSQLGAKPHCLPPF